MAFSDLVGTADRVADPLWLGVTAGLFAVLAVVAVLDARTLRIPDWLSLPLVGLGLAVIWAMPGLAPGEGVLRDHVIGAAGAYALFAVLGEVMFRRTGQEALGLGDAKLFAAAGAWLGWQALPLVLLIASVAGLLAALIARRFFDGGRAVAFGPWIALGFATGWLLPR